MAQRLVVIGADAAGMSAASAARRARGPDELEIVAFDRGNYTSYSACAILYFIGNDVTDVDALIARTPEQFARNHGIDARIGHEVLHIDTDRQAVEVRDLRGGAGWWEGFDQLMVATGAVPIRPSLPGADAQGIFGVQTLDDGLAVRAALGQDRPRRVVVVGAGYIGLELAEALCAWGVHVTVIDRGQAPLAALDPDMGGMLVRLGRFLGWTAEPLPAHTRHARRSPAHPAGHPNREGHVDARRRGRRADHPGPLIPRRHSGRGP